MSAPRIRRLPGEVDRPDVAPSGRAALRARTLLLRSVTRVPRERIVGWTGSSVGRRALRGAERVIAGGPIAIAGGPAEGSLLPTGRLNLDHAQGALLSRGTAEPPTAEAIRRHLPRGGVLWDVGANLGYFAVVAARVGGPGTQVLALDPVPGHAEATAEAAALNGFDDLHALALAAWRVTGEIDLVLPGEGAWAHLEATVEDAGSARRLRVRGIALDDLLDLPGVRPPDVVKIDVEGAELGVLEGLERTVREHRPVLLVETHDTADGVVRWAREHDHRVENLEGPEPVSGPGGFLTALVPRD